MFISISFRFWGAGDYQDFGRVGLVRLTSQEDSCTIILVCPCLTVKICDVLCLVGWYYQAELALTLGSLKTLDFGTTCVMFCMKVGWVRGRGTETHSCEDRETL
jgi:hypothetical protein